MNFVLQADMEYNRKMGHLKETLLTYCLGSNEKGKEGREITTRRVVKKAGAPKEKDGGRGKSRPPTLLIKPTESNTIAEVISKIPYRIKLEDSGAEVSSL